MTGTTLTFRPVTRARWADFEALFESPGAPKYCWCMAWRPIEGKRTEKTNADRKQALKDRVDHRVPIGLVGYDGDDPVAWVSIAPKQTFLASLGGEKPDETGKAIWSLVCMYLKRAYRKQGIGHQLIAAAVEAAKARGADVVEGYPVAPDAPSYRFMGFVPAFEAAGFTHAGKAGTRRPVMRLDLG